MHGRGALQRVAQLNLLQLLHQLFLSWRSSQVKCHVAASTAVYVLRCAEAWGVQLAHATVRIHSSTVLPTSKTGLYKVQNLYRGLIHAKERSMSPLCTLRG